MNQRVTTFVKLRKVWNAIKVKKTANCQQSTASKNGENNTFQGRYKQKTLTWTEFLANLWSTSATTWRFRSAPNCRLRPALPLRPTLLYHLPSPDDPNCHFFETMYRNKTQDDLRLRSSLFFFLFHYNL